MPNMTRARLALAVRSAAAALMAMTAPYAHAAAVLADPPQAAASPQAGAFTVWWVGFQEPALDSLQEVARSSQGTWTASQQAELATAYVALRVQNLRIYNAAALRDTTRQARELLAGSSPTRDVAQQLAVLDQRQAETEGAILAWKQERDAAVRRLLQLTSADAQAAKSAIAQALDNPDLPAFRRAVPQRLPASVLLSRPDVADAERALSAHSSMSMLLSGWIAPASQPAPLALPGNEAGMDDTLRQAGREVSWSLRQLIEASRQADTDARRLDARRLEVMAMQERVKAGDAEPARVLEAYQQFLAEADAMAQAQGQLALAWIALHATAPGSISALAQAAR